MEQYTSGTNLPKNDAGGEDLEKVLQPLSSASPHQRRVPHLSKACVRALPDCADDERGRTSLPAKHMHCRNALQRRPSRILDLPQSGKYVASVCHQVVSHLAASCESSVRVHPRPMIDCHQDSTEGFIEH